MDFRVEHQFPLPATKVIETMTDPDFYVGLELPDLGRPEVLERQIEGVQAHLRLRYTFIGHLDPIAQAVLGGKSPRWVQDVQLDRKEMSGQLDFVSEDPRRRLHGAASVTFVNDAHGSTRRIDGALTIAITFGKGAAERRIVAGVLQRLDVEAEAIRRLLNEN